MDHDVVMGMKGAMKSVSKMGIGHNRAVNTVKLRKAYDRYASDRQGDGLDVIPFSEWAKKNHPGMRILPP